MSILEALKSIELKREKQAQIRDNNFQFTHISDAVFTTALYRGGIELEEIDRLLTEPKENRDKILNRLNL